MKQRIQGICPPLTPDDASALVQEASVRDLYAFFSRVVGQVDSGDMEDVMDAMLGAGELMGRVLAARGAPTQDITPAHLALASIAIIAEQVEKYIGPKQFAHKA